MTVLDKLRQGIISDHPDRTEEIGSLLATALPSDCALALRGDLGSGKTTFTRGLARGIGVSAAVTSPTYNIFTIYKGSKQLVHMDAYRLQDAHELETLAVEELLKSPYIIAVEWPDNVRDFFSGYTAFWLDFEILQDHRHKITLQHD